MVVVGGVFESTGYSGAPARLQPLRVCPWEVFAALGGGGGFSHLNINFSDTCRAAEKQPRAASEGEGRRVLRKALPIIPLCKRGAGTQLQRSAVDCRERERGKRKKTREREESEWRRDD